jgi:hypothetical protein
VGRKEKEMKALFIASMLFLTGCVSGPELSGVYYHMDGSYTADYQWEEILLDGTSTGVTDEGLARIEIDQMGPATVLVGPDGLNSVGLATEDGIYFGTDRVYPALDVSVMFKSDGFMDRDLIQINYEASFWSTSTQSEGEDHIHFIVTYRNLTRTGR